MNQRLGTHANPHNLQGFLDAFKASFGCICILGGSVAGDHPTHPRVHYPCGLSKDLKAAEAYH
jgi:hypothetical protein